MTIQKNRVNESSQNISNLRESIDEIDEKIVALINQRLENAIKIGEIKCKKGNQVTDSSREKEIMDRLLTLNKGPIHGKALLHIFKDIISESRKLQQPQKITFLGPEATFTHMAAMDHFGHSSLYIPQPSIKDIFNDVEKGASGYGVVPVENSIEGAVNHTLDLFFESDLKICAEIFLPISHDLLSTPGSIKNIKKVYSHPQALAQCREWLKKYLPDTPLEECGSTALAAQKASFDPETAAIASSAAARLYNLEIVTSKIQDFTNNVTRFLVIGKDEIKKTGKDKTSIMLAAAHTPGALHKILEPIAKNRINMLKLESRPAKYENWNYFFFIDIEGHIKDPIIEKTISRIKELCFYLKCLGSYPMEHPETQA